MARRLTDQQLVERFLSALSDVSSREAGRLVEGVTHDDVSRWRRGNWSRLTSKKRDALLNYLFLSEGHGGALTEAFRDPGEGRVEYQIRASQLREILEGVEVGAGDHSVKIILDGEMIESLGLPIDTETQKDETEIEFTLGNEALARLLAFVAVLGGKPRVRHGNQGEAGEQ